MHRLFPHDLAADAIGQDASELKQASEAVAEILNKDPDLELEEHKLLRLRMKRFMEEQIGKMNL